jgi:hypothetical protein
LWIISQPQWALPYSDVPISYVAAFPVASKT